MSEYQLEKMLYDAIRDAVALLNKSFVVGDCEHVQAAHLILRKVLVSYADALMDMPLKPEERDAIHKKHNEEK